MPNKEHKPQGRHRVCHVINDLPVGGAEMMLYKLLGRLDRGMWEPSVISLISRGPMTERIEELGVPVDVVGMRRGAPEPGTMLRLGRLLRRRRPHVVQTWLYHANVLGGLAARLALGRVPVVWNIRMNSLETGIDKRGTFWALKLGARLSHHLPARIVVNSAAGLREHAAAGFDREKLLVIPNGFNLEQFRPSNSARQRIRRELGLADDSVLVGAVGRDHPHKDYGTFIEAAAQIAGSSGDVHFVLCGRGLEPGNRELGEQIRRAGMLNRFHLLGQRDDVPDVQAALDQGVLSSCTEGFPNVVGEAMACGVPCVVTDVGAAADIVGETGRVVPPRDPAAMAAACRDLLQLASSARQELGMQARGRIERHFSLDRVCEMYTSLWNDVLAERTGRLRRAA